MKGKLLFVVNPIAGNTNKENMILAIDQWQKNRGFEAHIYTTKGTEDKRFLKEKVEEIEPEAVIAVGGDGTLKLCVGLLAHTPIRLGLIPAGSANGMAAELQIPVDTDKALDIIEKGHTKALDLLEFNEEEMGMHISDIGLNAGLIERYEASPFRGFIGYAQGLVSTVQNFKAFEVEIKGDQEDCQSFRTYMVAFANAKRFGTGALLNNQGKIDDGKFEICIIKNLDLIDISRHFFDLINEDDAHMDIIQCQQASIKILGPKEPFQIDGEYKGEIGELTIKVLPQCLQMIVPQ